MITVPGTFANLFCDISQPASKIGQTMRIVFMAGGFSTTNVLFLNKFLQYGLDAHFVYTRMSPADFEVLKSVNTTWIDLSRFKYLPKLLRWLIFGYETISIIKKRQLIYLQQKKFTFEKIYFEGKHEINSESLLELKSKMGI